MFALGARELGLETRAKEALDAEGDGEGMEERWWLEGVGMGWGGLARRK